MARSGRTRRAERLLLILVGALVVSAGTAHAHFIDPDRSIVENGMMHTLGSYQQVVPLAALGFGLGRSRPWLAVPIFVLGIVAGYFFLGDAPFRWFPYLEATLFIACGLALLSNALPGWYLEMPPTAVSGLTLGMLLLVDAPDDPRALAFSAYAALAGLLVVLAFALVRSRLTWPWISIASRIAGAWLVAIGIMLMAAAATAPEYVDDSADFPVEAPGNQPDLQP